MSFLSYFSTLLLQLDLKYCTRLSLFFLVLDNLKVSRFHDMMQPLVINNVRRPQRSVFPYQPFGQPQQPHSCHVLTRMETK